MENKESITQNIKQKLWFLNQKDSSHKLNLYRFSHITALNRQHIIDLFQSSFYTTYKECLEDIFQFSFADYNCLFVEPWTNSQHSEEIFIHKLKKVFSMIQKTNIDTSASEKIILHRADFRVIDSNFQWLIKKFLIAYDPSFDRKKNRSMVLNSYLKSKNIDINLYWLRLKSQVWLKKHHMKMTTKKKIYYYITHPDQCMSLIHKVDMLTIGDKKYCYTFMILKALWLRHDRIMKENGQQIRPIDKLKPLLDQYNIVVLSFGEYNSIKYELLIESFKQKILPYVQQRSLTTLSNFDHWLYVHIKKHFQWDWLRFLYTYFEWEYIKKFKFNTWSNILGNHQLPNKNNNLIFIDDGFTPEEEYIFKEKHQILDSVVCCLDEEEKKIIELFQSWVLELLPHILIDKLRSKLRHKWVYSE